MTATAVNYAKTLYELSVSTEAVQTTKEIFREVPGLAESLENPLIYGTLRKFEKQTINIFVFSFLSIYPLPSQLLIHHLPS